MAEVSIAERNARGGALGRYFQFLMRRYQRLDLVEMADATEPIELRQIFVPMQVAAEDLNDEEMGRSLPDVRKETLPGESAWDLLTRERFVALSGRPGSGKSTLVQAVVAELCGEAPSVLRKQTRAVPVPVILRNLPELEAVKDLAGLLDAWWSQQADQATADKLPLDLSRLRALIEPSDPGELAELPVLLLFDGIDEIGGQRVRQRLFDIARKASEAGYRVLVTGRPTGYKDLVEAASQPVRLHHLLPFAWPQIERFITAWYALRDEWKIRQETGIDRFLRHMADPGRRHLLVLARRPIFLTLMALVNCTQNEMPEGRPLLYRRIVDLYLDRQERHRQRRWTTSDRPMPHWPAGELRSVLAHLAWRSQIQGSESERVPVRRSGPDSRRVVWDRSRVEKMVARQLAQGPGRFAVLKPENAGEIVDYFLHPAGLLVEPAEGKLQFAHLSFQEYLCAWFLHERGKISGLKAHLEKELFPLLERPGWDEVAILLLCIHAEDTGNEGHFEMLGWLDLAKEDQAALYVAALTGGELPFTDEERLERLPLAVEACLRYPGRELGRLLARVSAWAEEGRRLVLRLLREGDSALRDESLPRLINTTGWGRQDDPFVPVEPDMEAAILGWFESLPDIAGQLWERDSEGIPVPTLLSLELDALLPVRGELLRRVAAQVPVDGVLLQGEGIEDYFFDLVSQPVVLLTLNPRQEVGLRERLAITLYGAELLAEGSAGGRALGAWSRSRSRSRSLYRSRSLSLYRSRSLSLSLSLSRSRSRSRSLSLSLSRSLSLSLSLSRSLSRSLVEQLPLASETKAMLERLLELIDDKDKAEDFWFALSRYALRHAALDWFEEQAAAPGLAKLRGQRHGEPLPRDLGLLDERGCPLPVQQRGNWVRLGDWLDDDDEVLGFVFPEGLSRADRKLLKADLAQLRKQPWSPQAAVRMVLEDWPARQKHREITREAAERELVKEARALLRNFEKV